MRVINTIPVIASLMFCVTVNAQVGTAKSELDAKSRETQAAAKSADKTSIAKKSVGSTMRAQDCYGPRCMDKASCREFRHNNLLCDTYCMATNERSGNCQTALNCPLPCEANK